MLAIEEVYVPNLLTFELRPFQDRVLELVRLFDTAPAVRIRIIGTIAAGEPIEAVEGPGDVVEIQGPETVLHRHRQLVSTLRSYLCPYLHSASSDAFEIARVITPVLAGLKLSGKVPIELDPWIFAGIALMIARMGVAGFCTEHAADDVPEEPPAALPKEARRQNNKGRRPKR
jgi:hypothetical protein